MWVRSQDKKRMINMDNITAFELIQSDTDKYPITFFDANANYHYYAGTFRSNEKAMSVVNDICNALKGKMIDTKGLRIPEIIYQVPNEE